MPSLGFGELSRDREDQMRSKYLQGKTILEMMVLQKKEWSLLVAQVRLWKGLEKSKWNFPQGRGGQRLLGQREGCGRAEGDRLEWAWGIDRTEDEMVGWCHWLNAHGFVWTPGVGDGQGGLVCCSSWGCKESDTTERLNWTELALGCWVLGCWVQECWVWGRWGWEYL